MTKPTILVTSAAGRTGATAVFESLQHGFPVRALVRQRDARAKALEQAGAQLVIGDLFDLRDLRRALAGVQRAYHCPPFVPNLLHNTALFAVAAQEAKLEVVALMSQWHPHPSDPSFITREHWLANQIYRWMPSVDVIHINPGLFAFIYLLGLPMIAHFGMLDAPFGQGLNAPPSNEDIGRVAAGVLMNPAPHLGKSYRPTGPELLSTADIAAILSTVLSRKVTYRDAPFKLFVKAAMAQGFPLAEISQLRYYTAALKGGAFELGAPTEHVREVTGSPPEDFERTARRYIANPMLIHPALKIGSKLDAFRFLARMLRTRPADLDRFERAQGYPLLRNPVQAQDNADWRRAAEHQQLYLLHHEDALASARVA